MSRPKVLYLQDPKGISEAYRFHLQSVMQFGGVSLGDCYMLSVHSEVKDAYKTVKQGMKTKIVVDKSKTEEVKNCVDRLIDRIKPDFIVCNDPISLYLFSTGNDSLAQCRGSVYHYRDIPVGVFDNIARVRDTNYGKWVAANDWGKFGRWMRGEQREEPKFTYTLCRTRSDLDGARNWLSGAYAIAFDIETADDWITTVGYCGINSLGEIRAFVIPLFNPLAADGAHWESEQDELYAWETIRAINANNALKIAQNGQYDSSYFVKYRSPVDNYFADTQHLWHCLYCELPKRLDFIASICVDNYKFWKEESKGVKEGKTETTPEALERFWRYNALDCYYTLLSAIVLVPQVQQTDWARRNYIGQFSRQIGPALHMSCRGLRVDYSRLRKLRTEWEGKKAKALKTIKTMVDDEEFNPDSPKQVQQLFYDVLKCQPVRVRGRSGSSDEATLKLIGDQHIIIKKFADAILEAREPGKILSTYLYRKIRGSRLRYSMNAAGTETSRFSSGTFMWEGGNAQNIPEMLRDFIVADPGYVLFDVDLEQSDARYVAYESQDLKFIDNVESGKDTHCLHAAHFFKQSYDHIYERVKAKDPKYAHKVTGVRAVTKRIVHGSNFQMAAWTLFTTMGRDAVVAAALAIGIPNPHKMSNKQLAKICERFLEDYHVLYPRLRPWYREIEATLKSDRKLSTAFGWTRQFFGKSDDPSVQREATAFLGQGDTGGNINRAIDYIYWGGPDGCCLEREGVQLLLQVHDSLVGQVPIDRVSLVQKVMDTLELPITIHARAVKIPAAAALGFRWGAGMKGYSREDIPDWMEQGA